MKKTKSWITLTIVSYMLFLLWGLPAQYVLSFVENRNVLPVGAFSISGVEGAWTDGHILKFKTNKIELNNLSWRFQPSGLITGRLQFAMSGDFADGTVAGILRVGTDTVEFEKIHGQIPAASLGEIYVPGFELSGVLATDDLALVAENGYLTGASGQLSWRNAKVSSPYQMSLGGVVLDLATEKNGLSFKLDDLGGGLQVSGLGFLAPQGKFFFDGTVGVRQGSSPELATFLQILGKPKADGMVKIKFKGQIARFF